MTKKLLISLILLLGGFPAIIRADSIPFSSALNYGTANNPYSVFCADLDGDSDIDLAVANEWSLNVSILKNNGDGTFQTKVDYSVGNRPHSVFCADLDGDGDLDLALANSNSDSVSILKNQGGGTFQTKVDYRVGDAPQSVFCADLDGDEDLDLAVANFGSDSISILKNQGNGTFPNSINYQAGDGPISVFCADLDGDSDLDLAVANFNNNNVSIIKNNGGGAFQSAINYGVGIWPSSVFCADLDGDTDLDLAVANVFSDNVSILKNNGNGTFQTRVNYGVGESPFSVFCSDLDGGGDFDLAVANDGSNNVSILKNNGNGTFQNAVNYGAGDGPYSVFCADLDGERDFDLAVTNFNGNNISIFKNLTQIPTNQPPLAFSLNFPSDPDTTLQVVNFDWQNAYDPNLGDQVRYDLYVSTTPGFETLHTTIYPNSFISSHSETLAVGTYYWKVKALDNWGGYMWSSQNYRFFNSNYVTDTLVIVAFSPVDLMVTDPKEDSIGVDFNTIPGASYDTTQDLDFDGELDDLINIPNRLVGLYMIRVISEPEDSGDYTLRIRMDGGDMQYLAMNVASPTFGAVDTFYYNALWYKRGDANGDWKVGVADAICLARYILSGGPTPDPLESGDVNCDGKYTLVDVILLARYVLFGESFPC